MATFIFDLDGTILEHGTGNPIGDSVERINELYDAGHDIILITRRGDREFKDFSKYGERTCKDQLSTLNIKYHHLIFNSTSPRIVINDDGAYCLNVKTNHGVEWEQLNNSSGHRS